MGVTLSGTWGFILLVRLQQYEEVTQSYAYYFFFFLLKAIVF